MITIIPTSRERSAVYGGKADRVVIGLIFTVFDTPFIGNFQLKRSFSTLNLKLILAS